MECNETAYNSTVQRLINVTISKAFRTTSNEAFCTLTRLRAIAIKAEEAAKLYSIVRKSQFHEIDHEVQSKVWLNAADSDSLNKVNPLYIIHRRQQRRARGWSWNSNIYPEQFSASIKEYAIQ